MKNLLLIPNSYLQCNTKYRASPATFTFDQLDNRIQDQARFMIQSPKVDMARWSSNGWLVRHQPYLCVVIDPNGDVIQAAEQLLYCTPSDEISILEI